MSICNEQFEQAMQAVNLHIQTLDRALNARKALAEAEVLRLRSVRESGLQPAKFDIMDARKIYSPDLTDMGRWRPWTERVLRWARMQYADLHAALQAALKSRSVPVTHECGDESVFFWPHLEDWIKETEAAGMVKMVRCDDGVADGPHKDSPT